MKPSAETTPATAPQPPSCNTQSDRPFCPRCQSPTEERKQKWFCVKCKQLVMTCCD